MKLAAICLLALTGCFNPTYNNPRCGPAGQCPSGMTCSAETCIAGDGGDSACAAWTPHFFSPCAIGSPSGPVTLTSGNYTYNTTLATLVDATGAIISHATFSVDQGDLPASGMNVESLVIDSGAHLQVIGAKPLIIASWGSIEINGTIDVGSSTLSSVSGAGSSPALCLTSGSTENGGNGGAGKDAAASTGGSGGGGGAGFAGSGGAGGGGDNTINLGGVGGAIAMTPHLVRGGCAGGTSGQAGPSAQPPANANSFSAGGLGGGALQLTAQTTLMIDGTISAGGGGGQGAAVGSLDGGGGGGAGGFIGLEAKTIALESGAIAANGGGGGGGAARTSAGSNGQDGQGDASEAQGGLASSCSPTGGFGAGGGTANGQSVSTSLACGGGGGGGGTGFVLIFSNQITQNVTVQSPTGLVNPF